MASSDLPVQFSVRDLNIKKGLKAIFTVQSQVQHTSSTEMF